MHLRAIRFHAPRVCWQGAGPRDVSQVAGLALPECQDALAVNVLAKTMHRLRQALDLKGKDA